MAGKFLELVKEMNYSNSGRTDLGWPEENKQKNFMTKQNCNETSGHQKQKW